MLEVAAWILRGENKVPTGGLNVHPQNTSETPLASALFSPLLAEEERPILHGHVRA